MPKPVSWRAGEEVEISFDSSSFFSKLPKVAAAYGSVIASWAWTEQWYSNIRYILHISEVDKETAFKDPRMRKRQHELLLNAIKKSLGQKARIAEAALNVVNRSAEARNDVAHGMVGHSDTYPNAFLIFAPDDYREFFRSSMAKTFLTGKITNEQGQFLEAGLTSFVSKGVIFEATDFDAIRAENDLAAEVLRNLSNFCSPNITIAAVGLEHLLLMPEVVAELAKLQNTP